MLYDVRQDYQHKSIGTKAAHKTLMKLTHGLNFINVLRTAFALVGPKSISIQSSSQYLFTLLGSTGIKASSRTLMKLTPEEVSVGTLHLLPLAVRADFVELEMLETHVTPFQTLLVFVAFCGKDVQTA